jgi:hypothetical protein
MIQLLLRIASFLGLGVMLVSSIFYFNGVIGETTVNTYIMAGTLVYFATAIFWLGKKQSSEA